MEMKQRSNPSVTAGFMYLPRRRYTMFIGNISPGGQNPPNLDDDPGM